MARYGWIVVVVAVIMFGVALLLAANAPVLALVVAGLAVVIPGAIAMYMYFEWQNDSYVLSDQRIVRIWNQLIGFENTLSEIPLDRVLEVNVRIPPGDAFARLFRYGTVYVKTAGEAANMTLEMIPQPMRVQSMIFTQRDRIRERLEQRKREMVRTDIEQALGVYKPANQVSQTQQIRQAVSSSTYRAAVCPHEICRRQRRSRLPQAYKRLDSAYLFAVADDFGRLRPVPDHDLAPRSLLSGGVGTGGEHFVVVVGALWFYASDWDWRNDLFIIGSEAITLVRKRPLWLQNETERIRISQIDNVKSIVDGLIGNLLNRGNVRISLIGSDIKDAKVMDSIYDPQEVQAEISRRQSASRPNARSARSISSGR